MDTEKMHNQWDQVKDLIKNEWSDFTEKDLERVRQGKDHFVEVLKEKYGYSIEAAEAKLKKFMNKAAKEMNIDADEILKMGTQCMHQLEDKMKKNVFQTALIAFGIGLIVDRVIQSLFSSK